MLRMMLWGSILTSKMINMTFKLVNQLTTLIELLLPCLVALIPCLKQSDCTFSDTVSAEYYDSIEVMPGDDRKISDIVIF